VRATFNDWFAKFATTKENLTPKKYIKPPKIELIVEWILACCDKISETLIKKSFKHCSINNDILGSENSLINPKLCAENEIKTYLINEFSEKSSNPYNDREEVDTKIKNSEEGVSYEFIGEEGKDNFTVDCIQEEKEPEDQETEFGPFEEIIDNLEEIGEEKQS